MKLSQLNAIEKLKYHLNNFKLIIMYGKKRITIEKSGTIVLAGGKSYIPIGRVFYIDGKIVGKLRKTEYPFERNLNEINSLNFSFNTITEVRNFAKQTYKKELPL